MAYSVPILDSAADDKSNNDPNGPPLPEGTLNVLKAEKDRNDVNEGTRKSRVDMQSLPTRQYLDQTVVPILLQALSTLSEER